MHREDYGSSLALAQCHIMLGGQHEQLVETCEWLDKDSSGRSWDVKCQVIALKVRAGLATSDDLLDLFLADHQDGPRTIATFARALDATAFACRRSTPALEAISWRSCEPRTTKSRFLARTCSGSRSSEPLLTTHPA